MIRLRWEQRRSRNWPIAGTRPALRIGAITPATHEAEQRCAAIPGMKASPERWAGELSSFPRWRSSTASMDNSYPFWECAGMAGVRNGPSLDFHGTKFG